MTVMCNSFFGKCSKRILLSLGLMIGLLSAPPLQAQQDLSDKKCTELAKLMADAVWEEYRKEEANWSRLSHECNLAMSRGVDYHGACDAADIARKNYLDLLDLWTKIDNAYYDGIGCAKLREMIRASSVLTTAMQTALQDLSLADAAESGNDKKGSAGSEAEEVQEQRARKKAKRQAAQKFLGDLWGYFFGSSDSFSKERSAVKKKPPDSNSYFETPTIGNIPEDSPDNIRAWAETGELPEANQLSEENGEEPQEWPLWSDGDPVPENWTRVPLELKVYTKEIHTPNRMNAGPGRPSYDHYIVVTEWTVAPTKWLPSDDIRDWVKYRKTRRDRSIYEHLSPLPDGNIEYNETYEVPWSPSMVERSSDRSTLSKDVQVTVFQSQEEFEEWKKSKK